MERSQIPGTEPHYEPLTEPLDAEGIRWRHRRARHKRPKGEARQGRHLIQAGGTFELPPLTEEADPKLSARLGKYTQNKTLYIAAEFAIQEASENSEQENQK